MLATKTDALDRREIPAREHSYRASVDTLGLGARRLPVDAGRASAKKSTKNLKPLLCCLNATSRVASRKQIHLMPKLREAIPVRNVRLSVR